MKRSSLALLGMIVATGCGETNPPSVQHTVVTSPSHDCGKAANASIEANDGTFNLTNTCDSVLIKGANNKIRIEAAKKVEINGPKNVVEVNAVDTLRANSAGNSVKYRKALTKQRPDVVAIGDNNTIVEQK